MPTKSRVSRRGRRTAVPGDSEVDVMSGTRAARPRLLLVEDDRATYTVLKGILALRGWEVSLATTVAEAREALEEEQLDAAVLDLMLPDGAGDALVREFRERFPEMPIAVTTGVSDVDRLAAIHQDGPTVLLRKPIALPDLLKALAAPVRLA